MLGIFSLLVLASVSFAMAENETLQDNNVVNDSLEGELELNESTNGMAILGQQIKVWFTFNKENRIDAELKLARLRLIQANIAARNNNTVAMQKALEAHERIISRVQVQLGKLDGNQRFEELNNTAYRLVALERAIEVHQRRITFIQDMLNNSNLTQQEIAVLEMRLEKAQNNTAHLIQVSEDKKDNMTQRIMELRNITEEEASAIVEQRQERIEDRLETRQENRVGNR